MKTDTEIKELFAEELADTCRAIGLDEIPKYNIKITNYPGARIHPHFIRKPTVEIGRQKLEDRPYILASEAGHLVYDLGRKRLKLLHIPLQGEIFDYLNQIRSAYEKGRLDHVEQLRDSFSKVDRLIVDIEKIVSQSKSGVESSGLGSLVFQKIEKRFEQECASRNETMAHVIPLCFIRLAIQSELDSGGAYSAFLRSLLHRKTDLPFRVFIHGDYQGLLDEMDFFREEPKRIMEAGQHREKLFRLEVPKKRKLRERFSIIKRRK